MVEQAQDGGMETGSMSKTNLLAWLGGLCFTMGAGLFVIGSSGPVIIIVAAVLVVVGTLALVGARASRARDREGVPSARELPVAAAVGPSRAGTIGAVAGASLGALALLVALFVAEGEARGHGVFHLIFGTIALVLFVALDRWWRPREGTASPRVPLMLVLWLAIAGAFLESIGAAGYDELNSGQRIAWLTSVHNAVAPLGGLTLLVIPIALIVLGSVIVGRIRRSPSVP
jgi:hypothetical protein